MKTIEMDECHCQFDAFILFYFLLLIVVVVVVDVVVVVVGCQVTWTLYATLGTVEMIASRDIHKRTLYSTLSHTHTNIYKH